LDLQLHNTLKFHSIFQTEINFKGKETAMSNGKSNNQKLKCFVAHRIFRKFEKYDNITKYLSIVTYKKKYFHNTVQRTRK
jgi:hypothetical protein